MLIGDDAVERMRNGYDFKMMYVYGVRAIFCVICERLLLSCEITRSVSLSLFPGVYVSIRFLFKEKSPFILRVYLVFALLCLFYPQNVNTQSNLLIIQINWLHFIQIDFGLVTNLFHYLPVHKSKYFLFSFVLFCFFFLYSVAVNIFDFSFIIVAIMSAALCVVFPLHLFLFNKILFTNFDFHHGNSDENRHRAWDLLDF